MRNINKLDVSGKLHSLTQILAILGGQEYNSSGNLQHNYGADSFFMLPRKVLVYESSDIDSNTYFSIGRYNILDGGYSGNTIYNDVSIFGKGDLKYYYKGKPEGKYIGEFKEGRRDGEGVWFINGCRYEGGWKLDKFHGRGMLDTLGEIQEGYWFMGSFECYYGDELEPCNYLDIRK